VQSEQSDAGDYLDVLVSELVLSLSRHHTKVRKFTYSPFSSDACSKSSYSASMTQAVQNIDDAACRSFTIEGYLAF